MQSRKRRRSTVRRRRSKVRRRGKVRRRRSKVRRRRKRRRSKVRRRRSKMRRSCLFCSPAARREKEEKERRFASVLTQLRLLNENTAITHQDYEGGPTESFKPTIVHLPELERRLKKKQDEIENPKRKEEEKEKKEEEHWAYGGSGFEGLNKKHKEMSKGHVRAWSQGQITREKDPSNYPYKKNSPPRRASK